MEIQQLRHLVSAVACGNLLKAAEECNISQSGLSRSIRSLEDRLGVQLLIRKSNGVEPTVFGDSVLKYAYLILNEVARSLDEIRAIQSSQVGEVVVGVTQNYGYYFIPDVITEFQQSQPSVRVTVKTGGFLDLVQQLKMANVDFVFGLLGPIEEGQELTVELLREHHSRVIARSTHPLAVQAREVTPQELSAARWATLRGEGFQRNFANYFASLSLKAPEQVLKTDSIALIRQSISAANLLAVLPPDVVKGELDSGALVILDCDAPAEQTHVGFVTRRSSFVTPQQTLLTDRIRRQLSRPAPRAAAA